MLKGLATAVGVDDGLIDSSLRLMSVPLVEVQQREQLLPALAIHNLAQAVRPLGKALAILCVMDTAHLARSHSIWERQRCLFRVLVGLLLGAQSMAAGKSLVAPPSLA